jgi:hypothetical protein
MADVLAPTDEVGDETVERTHRWLVDKKRAIEANLSAQAAEIGEYLLRTFYGGDFEKACSHNPHKDVSLRKLCQRTDAPFSFTALRTFIQVAHNFRLLPAHTARELLPSHHALLYRVADLEERARMAVDCAGKHTSARQLRELVKGRGRRKPGAGRKPDAPDVKQLRRVRQELDEVASKLDHASPSDAQAEALVAEARAVRDQVMRIMDALQDRRVTLRRKPRP